jgi:hypothetical protein
LALDRWSSCPVISKNRAIHGFAEITVFHRFQGRSAVPKQQETAISIAKCERSTDILGEFKSQALGAGPQVGFTFMTGDVPTYTNLRGYIEVETDNWPKGASLFLTVNLPVSKLNSSR